jgi:hypothetical protein
LGTLPNGRICGRYGPVPPGHLTRAVVPALAADDQDRARGVSDDVVRDAAQDEAPDSAPAVGAHDHEVGGLRDRGVDDGGARLALPDEEAHPHARVSACDHDRLRSSLPRGAALVHPNDGRPSGEQRGRVNDADDQQVGPQVARQLQCLVRGALGRGREVRGEQDPPDPSVQEATPAEVGLGVAGSGDDLGGHGGHGAVRRARLEVTTGLKWRAIKPCRGRTDRW